MTEVRVASRTKKEQLVLAGAVGGAFLLGAAITYLFLQSKSGDEPPVRVRNGSLELAIIGSDKKWSNIGNDGKRWRFSAGTRHNAHFTVDIRPKSGSTCSGPVRATGTTITIAYNDGTEATLTVDPQSKKTTVKATQPLKRSSDRRLLTYEVAGHIASISVDQSTCTFPTKDALEDALVNDFD